MKGVIITMYFTLLSDVQCALQLCRGGSFNNFHCVVALVER